MSGHCGYSYFVGQWKVIQRDDDAPEDLDDIIEISGPEDKVKVECKTKPTTHTYPEGKYNSSEDWIEFPGHISTLRRVSNVDCVKYRIHYEPGLVTGSWTAEDNGGDPGGGEG